MCVKQVVQFIESLKIPLGPLEGEPLALFPWQRRFLKGFLSSDGEAAISVPTGAGKSVFLAALMLAYFIGPMSRKRTELAVICPTLAQTRFVMDPLEVMMRPDMKAEPGRFRVIQNGRSREIEDEGNEVKVMAVGANPRGIHGAGFRLSLVDELAQFSENKVDAVVSAVRSRKGKVEDARALWIGTRPDRPDHPFEQMVTGKDHHVRHRVLYSARENDPPFRKRTWYRANPSLRFMPTQLKEYQETAAAAKDNPELLPAFQALRLNMGVKDHPERIAGLLTPEVYKDLEAPEGVEIAGDYVLALDVGGGYAQTAAAAVTMESPNRVEALAAWPGIPALKDRAKGDNLARYRRMVYAGELLLQDGRRTVDLGLFLDACFERWGRPFQIVADRYRDGELLDTLEGYGYGEDLITWRGMGYKDGSEDVRRFQRVVTDRGAVFKRSLLMRTAFAVARTITDPAGNSKIAKQTERGGPGKDDAAVAVVLGIAEADRLLEAPQDRGTRFSFTPVEEFDPLAGYVESWDL